MIATDDELERVVENRLNRFLELGFDAARAADLAVQFDLDWHSVAALISAGCPHEIAYEIVT